MRGPASGATTAAERMGGRRLRRRLLQLYGGLVLYGASDALLVHAGLGLDPWDVFHQGVSGRTRLSIGTVSVVTGVAVLLLWIPLRERPGLGTLSNALLIGSSMDATLAVTPAPSALAARVPLMLAAVALNGLATGMYIAAAFGPGPRDGLMTGLHRVTGRSLRLLRTGIELAVLAAGVLLGGTTGVGTIVYAVGIGPLSQLFLRVCAVGPVPARGGEPVSYPLGPAGRGTPVDVLCGRRVTSPVRCDKRGAGGYTKGGTTGDA